MDTAHSNNNRNYKAQRLSGTNDKPPMSASRNRKASPPSHSVHAARCRDAESQASRMPEMPIWTFFLRDGWRSADSSHWRKSRVGGRRRPRNNDRLLFVAERSGILIQKTERGSVRGYSALDRLVIPCLKDNKCGVVFNLF